MAPHSAAWIVALNLVVVASTAAAQDNQVARGRLALAGLLGRHALGAGLELSVTERFAIAGRADGWPHGSSKYAFAGAGISFNINLERAGAAYAQALLGNLQCTKPLLDGARRCMDHDWHSAAAIMGGLEIALDDAFVWAASIEGGYSAATRRANDALNHFTFAAIIRLRP